ncbi:MAG: glycosyltransferase family 2 protein [Patescibacteria group bacterium]|jgi:dolichol-phosphate mannosyltransferase
MAEIRKISLVVPVFNEAMSLAELYRRTALVLANFDYEIIFVNDGSLDRSWEILLGLARENSRVKLINFSRNFGKEVATSAGLHRSVGEAVIIMDADLEHPPELIPELITKWQSGGQVVYTVRQYSQDTPWSKRLSSRLYYFLINRVAVVNLEPGATDFRLLDRQVVDVFNQLTERARFFRGLIDWLGFQKVRIEFTSPHNPQKNHRSYSFSRLWQLAVSSLTSFSLFPLRLAGYAGSFITLVSGVLLVIMLSTRWLLSFTYFSPISFVIVFNILLSGIILMCLGFIALYIGSIHEEILNRPLYIIREKVNFDEKDK